MVDGCIEWPALGGSTHSVVWAFYVAPVNELLYSTSITSDVCRVDSDVFVN